MQQKPNKNIPTYSLGEFSTPETRSKMYRVEVFDARRHFEVAYPHRHDFYEVLFLNQGSGIHIIDSNEYEIRPPCVFFMSPGQAHKLKLSHDIDGYILLFTAEFYLLGQANKNKLLELPFFFSVEQSTPPLLLNNTDDVSFLKTLFERGVKELINSHSNQDDIIRSLLDLILQTCNNLYPLGNTNSGNSRSNLIVKSLLLLIEDNYRNNFSIKQYADIMNITPNHLTQVVRKVTGKTSNQIIHDKVILETKRLLIHSDMTVTEIADYMSFADQSYFTKFFKKVVGITPAEYRKKV